MRPLARRSCARPPGGLSRAVPWHPHLTHPTLLLQISYASSVSPSVPAVGAISPCPPTLVRKGGHAVARRVELRVLRLLCKELQNDEVFFNEGVVKLVMWNPTIPIL